jgi:hypothetical protein
MRNEDTRYIFKESRVSFNNHSTGCMRGQQRRTAAANLQVQETSRPVVKTAKQTNKTNIIERRSNSFAKRRYMSRRSEKEISKHTQKMIGRHFPCPAISSKALHKEKGEESAMG